MFRAIYYEVFRWSDKYTVSLKFKDLIAPRREILSLLSDMQSGSGERMTEV